MLLPFLSLNKVCAPPLRLSETMENTSATALLHFIFEAKHREQGRNEGSINTCPYSIQEEHLVEYNHYSEKCNLVLKAK